MTRWLSIVGLGADGLGGLGAPPRARRRAAEGLVAAQGGPVDSLTRVLAPGGRVLALGDNGDSPGAVAGLLVQRGYGGSRLRVLEHLGGPHEAIRDGIAAAWPTLPSADLSTIAID